MFKLVNKNPKKRKAGDCAIRAICNAEDKNWLEVFDALVEIARRECFAPTDMNVINEYLKNYSTVSVMYDDKHGKKRRYKVEELDNLPKGSYIVRVAGHMTCVKNGVIEDTWDCGYKSCYKIWMVK